MDFDREMELENAGIDAFEFSLMDEDERREALEDAFLDPDDYDLIEYDTSFNAWSNLQNAGLSLSELEYMDEDEKRKTLRDAGLDPDDYEVYPSYTPSYMHYSAPNPVNTYKYIPPVFPKIVPVKPKATPEPAITPEPVMKTEGPSRTDVGGPSETPKAEPVPKAENKGPRKVYRFCGVRFENDDRVWYYRTGKLLPKSGDYVEVPFGPSRDVRKAKVISVGDYAEEVVPVPVEGAQYILRVLNETEYPSKRTANQENSDIPPVKETPDEQKKIRRVYDRVRKEKAQSLIMVYVTSFLVLLAGVMSFFLWKNNSQGDYDTILIVMGIAGAVFLFILFRALSAERILARKIYAAERRYPWLSDSASPGLKGYDRSSGSNDRLTITIIAIFVLSIAFVLIFNKVQEDRRQEAEAQAVRQAEEMYIQGLSQFSKGDYKAAYRSFDVAREKNIEESKAYYYYSVGMDYAASKNYDNAESSIRRGTSAAISTKIEQLGKQLLRQVQTEHKVYDEQQEKEYLQSLAKSLPYVGMPEKYISKTALGSPSSTVRHNREMVNGKSLVANLYDYTRNGYVIFTARCINGVVTDVFDHWNDPYKQSSGSSSSSSSKKSSSSTKKSDPFHASDYAHPDDFYYDYYDDFWDYEDAEDYWEAHH